MRKIILIISIIVALTLASCSKQQDIDNIDPNYVLTNGKTPTETTEIIRDALLKIYMPSSDKDIEDGVYKLSPISTEDEINELLSTTGVYNAELNAKLSRLNISIGTPENTNTGNMKILASFTLEVNNIRQNQLIEFKCNKNGMIESHNIWVNNN